MWVSRSSPGETTSGRIPSPHPGFLAPDFELLDREGRQVELSSLRGSPVIINYWASWCGPCRSEMPAIENISHEYAEDGLVILGVNGTNQDNLAAALSFVQELGITFPILLDETGEVGNLYRVQSLPTTFFIDPEGIVHDMIIGGMSETMLRVKVSELLEQTTRGSQ
jgi:cytochrome c biogenesis protein CcmG/thiol:disulfide interchange protein DsbE